MLFGYIVEEFPGVDPTRLAMMTDRQIYSVYFPVKSDRLPAGSKRGSMWDVFQARGRQLGYSDEAIRARWLKRPTRQSVNTQAAADKRKAKIDHARRVQRS